MRGKPGAPVRAKGLANSYPYSSSSTFTRAPKQRRNKLHACYKQKEKKVMPVIRIDQDVYAALERHVRAFGDTPNDVLRRLLQLEPAAQSKPDKPQEKPMSIATGAATPSVEEARVTGRRTKEAAFRRPILNALAALGGRARVRDVLTHVESEVRSTLAPVDHEPLGNGEVRWENTAKWERKRMIGDGLLRADSPHGTWELTAQGREAAQQPE